MNDMLNDLFLDKSIQILPEELAKEPIPFFKEQVNLELESLQDGGPKKTEIMGYFFGNNILMSIIVGLQIL